TAVFVHRRGINLVMSVLFVFAMGACGNFGGCGACGASQPLPGGMLPTDQTVEGGGQIRVTQQGFSKLTSILPGVLNQAFQNGFCVGRGSVGSPNGFLGTGAEWCYQTQGQCNPGCLANVSLNPGGFSTQVTNAQTLRLRVSTSVSATVPLRGQVVGIGASCTLGVTSNNLNADVDLAFGIKPGNGELDIRIAQINRFQLNMNFTGCSLLSDIANLASDIIDSFFG